jgi:hypothetical protein
MAPTLVLEESFAYSGSHLAKVAAILALISFDPFGYGPRTGRRAHVTWLALARHRATLYTIRKERSPPPKWTSPLHTRVHSEPLKVASGRLEYTL